MASGSTINPIGKRFSKKSLVLLYFSDSKGVYHIAKRIITDSQGRFSVTLLVKKPSGFYSWYALNVKTGKKSKVRHYKVV